MVVLLEHNFIVFSKYVNLTGQGSQPFCNSLPIMLEISLILSLTYIIYSFRYLSSVKLQGLYNRIIATSSN